MSLSPSMFEPVKSQISSDAIARPSTTLWQDAWRRFKKNYLAMIGLVVLGLLVLFSFGGPFFSQFNFFTNDLDNLFASPSWIHPFGTDDLGRDIMTRIMYGGRISLEIGLVSVMINLVLGVFYGGISGYFGGRVDNIMMRIIDIIYSVPDLLYVILLMVVLGQGGLINIMIVLGIVNWMAMARIVRGQILALREQEYVLAARTLGANTKRLLLKHLIPNTIGPIIVTVALQIPAAIFMEAFLSFIGIGIMPPLASWGSMASAGRLSIPAHPNALLFPSLAIAITMLAFNFVGDGLRDAFDPKMRK
ncbi:ABC transporter permease [Desulfosporosinus sp. Sb-LF]|uniref:ABC transporter permease n=1 Tax=Desulfosporosinus sp. Sb-LF TaxID=2560027 RepID=UPI00107F1EAA|nr:ABC transporter permease [Desulfosporosinus sp. Sb-LF]TGE32353.1 ABC transporter permease [Desulfosporosinus sp. Sb-LF]